MNLSSHHFNCNDTYNRQWHYNLNILTNLLEVAFFIYLFMHTNKQHRNHNALYKSENSQLLGIFIDNYNPHQIKSLSFPGAFNF